MFPLFSASEASARWSRTLFRVTVKGQDISPKLAPIIHSIKVDLKSGNETDTADIELDDTDGQIIFPQEGEDISIELGTSKTGLNEIFRGKLDEPRSAGARSSGRKITIHAKGMDAKSKVKEQQEAHWDNKPLAEVMQDAGKMAGLEKVIVDPELSKLVRPYWAMLGESFIAFAQRIARETGATFKVVGKQAIMAKRSGGVSATGKPLPVIKAEWGVNLLSWDMTPHFGRLRYKKARTRYYDRQAVKWIERFFDIDDAEAIATYSARYSRANAEEAETQAKADATEAERSKGGGTILIDGDAAAQPECALELTGARDGIDGEYRIDSVSHDLTRSNGFTSSLIVKRPKGEAGKDKRAGRKKLIDDHPDK